MVSVFTGYFARSVCFHFQIVHYLFLLFFHSLRRLSIVFPFVQCETAETNFDRMWHIKGIFANFVRCSLSRDIHVMAQPSLWLIGGWLIGSKVQKSCSKRNRKYWNVPLFFFPLKKVICWARGKWQIVEIIHFHANWMLRCATQKWFQGPVRTSVSVNRNFSEEHILVLTIPALFLETCNDKLLYLVH